MFERNEKKKYIINVNSAIGLSALSITIQKHFYHAGIMRYTGINANFLFFDFWWHLRVRYIDTIIHILGFVHCSMIIVVVYLSKGKDDFEEWNAIFYGIMTWFYNTNSIYATISGVLRFAFNVVILF